jgi:hypothetical protein
VAEVFSSSRICILVAEFKFFSGRIYFLSSRKYISAAEVLFLVLEEFNL